MAAEDEDFLYLFKPSGVPVFVPRKGVGPSMQTALEALCPSQRQPQDGSSWPSGFELGIAHRLDGWTSGLLIAARSLAALAQARQLFSARRLTKHYLFVTDRQVAWVEHLVAHPLAHDRRRKSRMVWKRGRSTPHRGRWYEASTRLRLAEQRAGSLSLWRASMASGVMHQIRVHAAAAGLPLLGDRLYGGSVDPSPIGRFYLHHSSIDGWPGPGMPTLPIPEFWP